MSTATAVFDRFPSARRGWSSRYLWIATWALVGVGIACHALGFGIAAMWMFAGAAVTVAIVLPLPYAIVSPLFMGVIGWLVDMLPFVILVGWTAVAVRWSLGVLMERRLPRGGRWIWLPIGIAAWTSLGVLVISPADLKGFALIVGIQCISSAVILAVVDSMRALADRMKVASALVAFTIVLSAGVFLQWAGVNIEGLQDRSVAVRAEAYYGLDAFPNNLGMIKWARSINSGAGDLRHKLNALAATAPGLPEFSAFRPKFQAYPGQLIVRFAGSARPYEDVLMEEANVALAYDSLGFAPANTVPRLRSFPRNALTYAGVCAAVFPIAFAVMLLGRGRRRWLGLAGVVAALFGAGTSLARGAWIAMAIGVVYLAVDGTVSKQTKLRFGAALLAGAVALTGVYLFKYRVDPVTGRAGGGASVNTRGDLYGDTISTLRGKHLLLGYATTQPRTDTGTTRAGTVGRRYVPRAGTHSTYLNYLFRTGLPGGLMIVALYGLAILHSRAAARSDEDEERTFNSMLATAAVIAAAHAVILSLYVEPVYTLTISLVIGMAMAGAMGLRRSILPWRGPREDSA